VPPEVGVGRDLELVEFRDLTRSLSARLTDDPPIRPRDRPQRLCSDPACRPRLGMVRGCLMPVQDRHLRSASMPIRSACTIARRAWIAPRL